MLPAAEEMAAGKALVQQYCHGPVCRGRLEEIICTPPLLCAWSSQLLWHVCQLLLLSVGIIIIHHQARLEL